MRRALRKNHKARLKMRALTRIAREAFPVWYEFC